MDQFLIWGTEGVATFSRGDFKKFATQRRKSYCSYFWGKHRVVFVFIYCFVFHSFFSFPDRIQSGKFW